MGNAGSSEDTDTRAERLATKDRAVRDRSVRETSQKKSCWRGNGARGRTIERKRGVLF
jgi:hypothetical protein